MSNIIITGISSFIGIHLAKYFSRNSYNVIGTISRDISKYDGIRKVRIAEALNSEVRIEKLDITQSDELINRKELEDEVIKYTKKYKGKIIPRPLHWIGYIVNPVLIEFWQEMPFRLHDRVEYKKITGEWTVKKLYP